MKVFQEGKRKKRSVVRNNDRSSKKITVDSRDEGTRRLSDERESDNTGSGGREKGNRI